MRRPSGHGAWQRRTRSFQARSRRLGPMFTAPPVRVYSHDRHPSVGRSRRGWSIVCSSSTVGPGAGWPAGGDAGEFTVCVGSQGTWPAPGGPDAAVSRSPRSALFGPPSSAARAVDAARASSIARCRSALEKRAVPAGIARSDGGVEGCSPEAPGASAPDTSSPGGGTLTSAHAGCESSPAPDAPDPCSIVPPCPRRHRPGYRPRYQVHLRVDRGHTGGCLKVVTSWWRHMGDAALRCLQQSQVVRTVNSRVPCVGLGQ